MEPQGIHYRNAFQTGYLCGVMDYDHVSFTPGDFEELDRGHDFYASQTFMTPDGRRVCIAWMDMWLSEFPEQREGWAGMLTLPRELHVMDGRLRMTPVQELLQLREPPISTLSGTMSDGRHLASPPNNRFEMLFSCTDEHALSGSVGIRFDWGDGHIDFRRDGDTGRLVLDRGGDDGERICEHPGADHLDLRIFVDNSSIEVFVNSGEETFSSRIYPTGSITATLIASTPTIEAESVCYALKKAVR